MQNNKWRSSIVEHTIDSVILGSVAQFVRKIVLETPEHYVRGLMYPLELLKCILLALAMLIALARIRGIVLPLIGHVRTILLGIIVVLVVVSSMLQHVDRPWPARPDWLTGNIATIVATLPVVVIVLAWNKCVGTRDPLEREN